MWWLILDFGACFYVAGYHGMMTGNSSLLEGGGGGGGGGGDDEREMWHFVTR